ncbi:MAG TPA: tetratricopeptide repeat protein [Blastocatellia bacterium]|nr:tetratricopeptide repeat protein [Blastocatellia bacterium]
MQILDRPIYRVAGIEVDPARGSLRRDGEELALRQKSLQVLLYLLDRRGQLVTKEELIENVWGGAAVTPDALVQIIVELRRLLGDDSRQPRFIRTVPKAGYRFIGPVEESLPHGAYEVEEITSVQVEFTEEFHQPDQPAAPPALTTRRTWRRPPLVWLAVLGIGLVALTALLAFHFSRRRPAAAEVALPHVPGRRAVAVLYFENQSGDRELDWLREGLADMLITNLSRSPRLTLLSRQQLAALLDHIGYRDAAQLRLEDGLEVGRRAQAEVLILGRFARLGHEVRIDVTLHEARTGQIEAAEALVVERPELILTEIDSLSLKLASHLGADFAGRDEERGLAAAMTDNLDAYRYYSLALEQTQMFQFDEAIALLEKAIALDPQFAMAYARVGYIYAAKVGSGEKALPYLEKAFRLSERLNERDKLFIVAWRAQADHDPARAGEIYRELLARYPLETEAWQQLNWMLQAQDRNEEALQAIRQGLVTDPEAKDIYNALGSVCMRLGRNEEALAAYQRYIQLTPNDPNAWDSLALFHQWLGQYDQALAAYGRALALNPESRIAIIHLGNLYFQQGRYRAAVGQYQRYLQIARDNNQRARSFNSIARVWLKQGDLQRAAAAIGQEVKYLPSSLWTSLTLALARDDQAAAQKLSETVFMPASYNHLRERGFLRIWNYQRGYLSLRQGRAEEALNHFREALRERPVEWDIDSYEDCLANAYLELGRTDEAVAEYERILRLNPNYPLAQYHLGQAYERKGERDRAQAAYERFLQIWKDADQDIPEVIAAKARITNR